MKRLLVLIVILTLLVVAGTIASAEGQTLHRSSVVGGKRATAIGAALGATGLIFTLEADEHVEDIKRSII
jgi:hypothetical protein